MTRGRWWRWIGLAIAGLLLYALLLVVLLPAEYVARAVNALNDEVFLQNPTGSAWDGSAQLSTKRNGKLLGQFRWTIHPWRLLTGVAVADVQLSGHSLDARATAEAGIRRYRLQRVSIQAPAASLSQFYPAIALAGISGQLRFNTETLEIDANEIRGAGELTWHDAATRLLPLGKIGAYRLALSGQGDRITAQLSTIDGPLRADGSGEWQLFGDGALRFTGTLSSAVREPTLDVLLDTVGPVQADGARRFNFETRLPLTKNRSPRPGP
jgi:hypothetical protein